MRYNQFERLADDIDSVMENLDDHGGNLESMDLSDYERNAIIRLLRSLPYLLTELNDAI